MLCCVVMIGWIVLCFVVMVVLCCDVLLIGWVVLLIGCVASCCDDWLCCVVL